LKLSVRVGEGGERHENTDFLDCDDDGGCDEEESYFSFQLSNMTLKMTVDVIVRDHYCCSYVRDLLQAVAVVDFGSDKVDAPDDDSDYQGSYYYGYCYVR